MSNDLDHQDLWTINEFSEWLRISPAAARAMVRRQELPERSVLRIGRRVRIRSEMIKEWVLGKARHTG